VDTLDTATQFTPPPSPKRPKKVVIPETSFRSDSESSLDISDGEMAKELVSDGEMVEQHKFMARFMPKVPAPPPPPPVLQTDDSYYYGDESDGEILAGDISDGELSRRGSLRAHYSEGEIVLYPQGSDGESYSLHEQSSLVSEGELLSSKQGDYLFSDGEM